MIKYSDIVQGVNKNANSALNVNHFENKYAWNIYWCKVEFYFFLIQQIRSNLVVKWPSYSQFSRVHILRFVLNMDAILQLLVSLLFLCTREVQ